MNKVKAWNASNSRAITKFHYADIGYFELKMLIHELIRGTLRASDQSVCAHEIHIDLMSHWRIYRMTDL